ncbi:hypothetical protein D9758_010592 [Tetrapyrgos nigripes]|uniref:Uncharacterized protein n=1 Tax=Tetrapyrgos nigripes TaxID=182062 RepID=A0A8H5D6W8_9AGAR|nr:hypothetical protein D9758_010592 [Tetrapyrgos nigripes]
MRVPSPMQSPYTLVFGVWLRAEGNHGLTAGSLLLRLGHAVSQLHPGPVVAWSAGVQDMNV